MPFLFSPESEAAPRLLQLFDTDAGTVETDLVVTNGTNSVTKIADNSSSTMPNGIFGFAFEKPTATSVNVMFVGLIGGFSGLTPGGTLFVSTSGTPTHTPPTTGMLHQIGYATSTTEIFVDLRQAVQLS